MASKPQKCSRTFPNLSIFSFSFSRACHSFVSVSLEGSFLDSRQESQHNCTFFECFVDSQGAHIEDKTLSVPVGLLACFSFSVELEFVGGVTIPTSQTLLRPQNKYKQKNE
eukprot:gb/GECG01006134.1/.p1 GENE.gb/GECG01006134.1/~~gb/GECG01006134.1/.p1  ORF type:complete len:111 (+),score=10.70 gb/GECG01006134.1/:1-333(+)